MYRDQSGNSQAAHRAHWSGFSFEGGNVVSRWKGAWGVIQVWAASEAEGRRVIEHACTIAGIPLPMNPAGEWIVQVVQSSRNGKGGTFTVPDVQGIPAVTKRDGPSGPSFIA
jgi:hypothetical protein